MCLEAQPDLVLDTSIFFACSSWDYYVNYLDDFELWLGARFEMCHAAHAHPCLAPGLNRDCGATAPLCLAPDLNLWWRNAIGAA